MEPITIPPQDDTQPVMLADDVAPISPPKPEVAASRAEKAYIGLGKATGKSQADFRAMIQSGREQEMRDSAASTLTFQAAEKREEQIRDAANRKGAPLTYEEAIKIVDPFNPANKPADPHDVIEKAYANSYVSAANTAATYMQGTILDTANKEIPERTRDLENKQSETITKIEFAKTLEQNIHNEIEQQGTFSWLADQGKTMLQPYNEFKMRGLNPDVGSISGGVFLGNNLKAQADDLFMQNNYEAYKTKLTDIVTKLRKDNPTLAAQFLSYITAPSEAERITSNIFTALTPMDYASIGNVSKSLFRKIEVNNRATTAFKQITTAAAKADGDVPIKAVMEEASGDVKNAGVTRAADNIAHAIDGTLDPVKDIKESFTSNFRLDGDLLDSKPGNLSAWELTTLKDSFYKAGSTLYDSIMNALKVNRTPVPLASAEAFRSWQIAARGSYPGEVILDIGSPMHMRETNTYHIPFTYGNNEGRLFSDAETAYNYARMRGYADPRIMSATGTVEKEAGKLVGSKTDLATKNRLEKSIPVTEDFLKKDQDFLSRKFVGPRRAEDIAAVKERIKSTKEILDRDKATLAETLKKITTSDPIIEQNGLGYKFVVIRPYKETDEVVRRYLLNDKNALSTSSAEGFNSWKNSFLGWVRGADDTLSYNETLNRKIATYTQSVVKEWAKDEAAHIEAIANQFKWYKPLSWAKKFSGENKEIFRQFNDTLKFAKTMTDKKGDPGYFFKTPGELQDHYSRFYQRLPSFPEVQAYFAHVKLLEGNRVLSEIAEFRNRARLGSEQHQIFTLAKDGTKLASGFFDGIHQKEFPQGGGQLIVMGEKAGEEKLYNLGGNNLPGKRLAEYKAMVESGQAKIVRIYDPDSFPLRDFSDVAGGNRVRYILTKNSESKPLDFNHVNRRAGGHFEVDADYYVKQANFLNEFDNFGEASTDKRNILKKIYTGDNTLMPMKNHVIGKDVVTKMNQMNFLMKEGKTEEAQALSKTLGIEWEEMNSWYDANRFVNGKKVGPRLNWDEPFHLVPRNKLIYDLPEANLVNRTGVNIFQDGTKSGSDARQFQVAYNQARDSELMHTITDVGSQGNPIYKMVQAEYVDPIPTMNKALNRAISSTFMDDYKIGAVEHWLAEAMPYFKADEKEIRSAPFWHFNNADRGAFISGTNPAVIDNLLSNRFKINQFVGMPNKVETYIHGATQLLADEFYKKLGPEENRNFAGKAVSIVPLWALSKWEDPISGIRSFAFNAKLGIFSIPQFLVQSQTYTNIIGLSPKAGIAGTYATLFHQWARVNSSEKFLKAFDEYATKLNVFGSKWKTGEWMEARQELKRSGFEHVGGEYQLADDAMQHKFIKNEWNNFLDAGQVFFREGEKNARLGAYYTAFREFRDANPLRAITEADRAGILNRADLLTNNMSRASASKLNSSLFSLPTQFLTYQVRMAELFFSKRIGETVAERSLARARILGMYAAMYGAPGALGVTGYPFGDSVRQAAINHGYIPGDNQFNDALMNGVVAWGLAMASGSGDYGKGNQYDVQGRYGTQGMTFLQESMRSDKTIWSLLGGAGVDTFMSTIGHVDPFWQFARQLVTDDEEGNKFKLTPTHFINLFSEVSAADSLTRGIYALHTGRWLSKNESYIENVTAKDTLFRTITGLKSQDQTDIFTLRKIKESEEAVQKAAEKEIRKDYQRGLDAVRDKDFETAETYFTNARARMMASGIPVDRRSEIMANASRGLEPQIVTSQWTWATKNVPAGQEATRLDSATKRIQIQNYRNQ